MPPTTRKGYGPISRWVVQRDPESDDESDDFSINETSTNNHDPTTGLLAEEERLEYAKLSQLADLGSDRRHRSTKDNARGNKSVNTHRLYLDRDCNKEGSRASKLAVENKAEIKSWANFGNTAVAKDGTYEDLPDIAGGQSHRPGVRQQLHEEGILSLEDVRDGPRPRGQLLPPFKCHRGPAGSVRGGGVLREGRGGGCAGFLACSSINHGSTSWAPSTRPLDPAIVDGERDSKYSNGGMQPKAKGKKGLAPSIRMENNTVNTTVGPGTGRANDGRRGGRAMQVRPWPPASLAHLALADPNAFMAATDKLMTAKGAQSTKSEAKVKNKPPMASTSDSTLNPVIASTPAFIGNHFKTQDLSTAVNRSEQAAIQQLIRDEFRPPCVSPTNLAEGQPSPVVLQSPSLESEQEILTSASAVGLGISGIDQQPTHVRTVTYDDLPSTIEIETAILREFMRHRDFVGLYDFLVPLLDIDTKPRPIDLGQDFKPDPLSKIKTEQPSTDLSQSDSKDSTTVVRTVPASKTSVPTQTTPSLAASKGANPNAMPSIKLDTAAKPTAQQNDNVSLPSADRKPVTTSAAVLKAPADTKQAPSQNSFGAQEQLVNTSTKPKRRPRIEENMSLSSAQTLKSQISPPSSSKLPQVKSLTESKWAGTLSLPMELAPHPKPKPEPTSSVKSTITNAASLNSLPTPSPAKKAVTRDLLGHSDSRNLSSRVDNSFHPVPSNIANHAPTMSGSASVLGDSQNVSRLTKDQMSIRHKASIYCVKGNNIPKITAPGPGFESLLLEQDERQRAREMTEKENLKAKEAAKEAAEEAAKPIQTGKRVFSVLDTAIRMGVQFGGNAMSIFDNFGDSDEEL